MVPIEKAVLCVYLYIYLLLFVRIHTLHRFMYRHYNSWLYLVFVDQRVTAAAILTSHETNGCRLPVPT